MARKRSRSSNSRKTKRRNNKREHDDVDGGAGDDVHQLDMIELTIVPC